MKVVYHIVHKNGIEVMAERCELSLPWLAASQPYTSEIQLWNRMEDGKLPFRMCVVVHFPSRLSTGEAKWWSTRRPWSYRTTTAGKQCVPTKSLWR